MDNMQLLHEIAYRKGNGCDAWCVFTIKNLEKRQAPVA